MKWTSSMVYKETAEATELYVSAVNEGELYRRWVVPVLNNLAKKFKKGIYDRDKAIDAFYPIATQASKQYQKDFGYGFSVQDRFTCACMMEERYYEDLKNGSYDYAEFRRANV